MSTPNPDAACPALHVLVGAMGAGRWPEHAPDERGRCGHCHTHIDATGDRAGPSKPWSHRPWHT